MSSLHPESLNMRKRRLQDSSQPDGDHMEQFEHLEAEEGAEADLPNVRTTPEDSDKGSPDFDKGKLDHEDAKRDLDGGAGLLAAYNENNKDDIEIDSSKSGDSCKRGSKEGLLGEETFGHGERRQIKSGLPEGHDPNRPVRVYADGIYDLFHIGHARSLEQAKKLFPYTYLLVGCCNDALTQKYKGKTVMNEKERYESLRHCRWVDEVVEDAPWAVNQEFLDKHKIDYVAHDALPYADSSGGGQDVYAFVKQQGKFRETKRTEGISTSDLIMRMLKDYNQYVMRNLARGYSRKELGVSYVMEKQLYMNMGIKKLQQQMEESVKQNREYIDRNMKAVSQNIIKALHTDWVKNTDSWIKGFVRHFDAGFHFVEKAIQSQIKRGLMMPKKPRQKGVRIRSSVSVPRSLQIAAPSFSWKEGEGGSGQRPPMDASTAHEEVISAT